ncbi:hypothetical protein PVAP13_5KG370614 [Panicum virgatum]|uniref:Uncharacterized protein n=1 Tax=Panicum virgatum TaxID=38727 RepID=A0A8T0SPN7_PANVG|nr:hypothetical protein PVAP13_5KG370614 [Panicum virgatum]
MATVQVVSRRLMKASDTHQAPHPGRVQPRPRPSSRTDLHGLHILEAADHGLRRRRRGRDLRGWPAFLPEPLLPARRPHRHNQHYELRRPRDPLQQPGRRARCRARRRRGAGEPGLRRDGRAAAEDRAAVRRGRGAVGAGGIVRVRRLRRGVAHQPRRRGQVRAGRARHRVVRAHTLGVGGDSPRGGPVESNHDRSVFRPRAPPSYGAALDEAFAPLDARRQVDQSSVLRFYHVDAADVARLREAASRGSASGHRVTRVEAVSA